MEGKTETTVLSRRIAALRKNRGLTQEQLGALVGVTAQAVSKWEKGGAPDVELLPSLAEHLGVSIDTLFGRSEQELEDMPKRLDRWLTAHSPEDRIPALFSLLAQTFRSLMPFDIKMEVLPYDSCYSPDLQTTDSKETWLRSKAVFERDMALGVLSKDFPLYLLLPEPEDGYGQNFADKDEYRRLFTVLSKPGCLEILYFLYGKKPVFYTSDAVAKHTSLPSEEVKGLLADMEKCHLIAKKTLEASEGELPVYILHDNQAFVPFLYFARWFMEAEDAWIFGWDTRERPVLSRTERKRDRKNEKE